MSIVSPHIPLDRGIFCNRTLNLRSISAIGYDMDYTLVHYNVEAWEGRAYYYIKQRLIDAGWPIEDLRFDPSLATRGLVIDIAEGNLVKANRFGYIKRASHGTRRLDYREMRAVYNHTLVDLGDARYVFLNTLFSISEACMYAQLVDLLDQDLLPDVRTYANLYYRIRSALDAAHVEGELKADIMGNPERYVELDENMPLALLDQKRDGKRLMVITNSEWHYTRFMLSYACDPFLPGDMTWRELFDVVIVSARKPLFFTSASPVFEVDEASGLLRPVVGKMREGHVYFGGHAELLESYLGVSGDSILYVGDHIFTDVNLSNTQLNWRTAFVLRELEVELEEIEKNRNLQAKITDLMHEKEQLEDAYSRMRLDLQRIKHHYGPHSDQKVDDIESEMKVVRDTLVDLDSRIAPLVIEDGRAFNENWGYLMRAGNDKSHLARQIERYADIYTSRVSNFLKYTPFMYFRSPRGSLPHDE